MDGKGMRSIAASFGELDDPRVLGRGTYPLMEILRIAMCAAVAGANSWVDVETFGHSKAGWLKQYLALENGIPSHDTFGDVFRLIDGDAFQRCFMRWVEGVFQVTRGQVIAVDGKTVRRSHDKGSGKAAIHLVNAWASENGLTLGQRQVDDKSNDITAIPELLEALSIQGCIVTVDAMGCHKDIAQTIRDGKADYVLHVKDNQAHLLQDVQDWFAYADQVGFAGMTHDYAQTVNKGHGRIDIRRCWTVADPLAFEVIRHYDGWADLHSIIRIERERRIADRVERDVHFFISSLPAQASLVLHAVRQHWSVENNLHWVLDVVFREDDARLRMDDAAQNMAVVRHIALNILKAHSSKLSLSQKRFRAALDDSFLLKLLSPF